MIDAELVTRKAALITKDLRALGVLARTSTPECSAGQTQEVLAERYLERAIGRMIDVDYHLVTEAGQPPPSDYFQSFTDLAQTGAGGTGRGQPIDRYSQTREASRQRTKPRPTPPPHVSTVPSHARRHGFDLRPRRFAVGAHDLDGEVRNPLRDGDLV